MEKLELTQMKERSEEKIEIEKGIEKLMDYAFAENRTVKEIFLPDSVREIGRHCFYNCRGLEFISLSDAVTDIGDGAFKNCHSLHRFHIRIYTEKGSCIKNILSECNQELEISFYQGKEMYKLVFPKYQLDFEANVEARIINQITYGSGVHYRECTNAQGIDIKAYDKVFAIARYEDAPESLLRLVYARLITPFQLADAARQNYIQYWQEHFSIFGESILQKEDMDTLREICEEQLLDREQTEWILQKAHEQGKLSMVTYLMQFKKNAFGEKKRFSL